MQDMLANQCRVGTYAVVTDPGGVDIQVGDVVMFTLDSIGEQFRYRDYRVESYRPKMVALKNPASDVWSNPIPPNLRVRPLAPGATVSITYQPPGGTNV